MAEVSLPSFMHEPAPLAAPGRTFVPFERVTAHEPCADGLVLLVFEATREATGTGLVFARSATAGSQRYPVHWSGDAQSTWGGMAGALRGGLGFACSGGALWGHDITVERGSASAVPGRDERGAVLAIRAPAGARLRLSCP
jgi:hypothetical protein